MQNENNISNAISVLYENEMTENGLSKLRDRFPVKVIRDMTNEAEFKSARKIRTEKNKLVEAITARRINVTADIKSKGDLLIIEVIKAFDPVVVPFEKQLIENKLAKEKAERELKELLDNQRLKLNKLNRFVDDCIGRNSKYISETIEAVDSVDTTAYHKDLIHEAISTKDSVFDRLTELLTQAIAEEALQVERKKLADEKKENDEKNRLIELKQKAQERLNNLIMIPSTMFDKTSKEVDKKSQSIVNFEIKEDEFGELKDQAIKAVDQVLMQLKTMFGQKLLVEKAQAEAAEKIKQEELVNQQQAQTEQSSDHNPIFDESKALEIMEELDIDKTTDNLMNAMDNAGTVFNVETNKPVSERLTETFKDVPDAKPDYDVTELRLCFLQCLISAGVDNWSGGYDMAIDEFSNLYPGANIPR